MEILNNPWVIGIGGGILSGIIVTAITRYIFSKRDNREYAQKVSVVNREVIYAVRPGISEGEMPTIEIIKSLIHSTSRKYSIEAKDAYSPSEISDDLIKEVMDSSFISNKTKNEYCKRLEEIKSVKKENINTGIESQIVFKKSVLYDYRDRMIKMMSIMLGIISAVMTAVFSFSEFKDSKLPTNYEVFLPTIIIALIITITTLLIYLYRKLIEEDRIKRKFPSQQISDEKTNVKKSNITSLISTKSRGYKNIVQSI